MFHRLSPNDRADLAGARRGGQAALTEAAARALEELVAALDEAGQLGGKMKRHVFFLVKKSYDFQGGGLKLFFLIFVLIWGNDPIWLLFLKWVETTN